MQSFLDMALALLVAERRLVEPAALQECILEQRRRSGEPLGQLLVRRRLVAPRDLLALTRAARAVVFVCATCRGAMAYGEVDPRAPPRCPRCGGRVAARSASGPTPATPASRSPSSTETLPVEDSPRPRADTRRGPSSAPSGSALRGGASLIGRRFGPYEVLRELGRGGMGVVYEARQARLERRVALKVLLGGDLSSAHHVARFQREAELAARLKHPNIARIHDVGVVDGLHYYAMDLIEGRPLADLLRESAIEVHRAVEIARDAARALGHAHRLGVVHRDVKPGNILVDEGGRAVVTDFGLARELDADAAARLTRSGAQVGTPRYMSPEQAGGRDDEVGPASDVFGLGVVLYELLTRRPPFSGSDLGELTRRISEDDPPPPSRCARGIPPPLDAVVLEALAKRPEDRYPSGAEFADDLERFLRGEPVLARARSPLERSWRWLRSRALLAGGSLAGGLLVAGLLLVPAGLGRSVPGESAPTHPARPPRGERPPPSAAPSLAELRDRAERAFARARTAPDAAAVRPALEEAEVLATKALAAPGGRRDAAAWLLRARLRERLARAEDAARDYREALERAEAEGDPAEAAFRLARLLLRSGRKDEGISVLLARREAPGAEPWAELGEALLALERDGDGARAYAAARRALDRDPLLPAALLLAGRAALSAGDLEEAERFCERAVAEDGSSATAWVALAFARSAAGREAVPEAIDRALAIDPGEPTALRLRARLRCARGERHAALDDLLRALAGCPDDADLLFDLAQLHRRLGEEAPARDALARLVQVAPADPRPYELRAYRALGDHDFPGCLRVLREGLARVPEGSPGWRRLERTFARLAIEGRQRAAAEDWIASRLAARPGDPAALCFRARVLAACGEVEAARELLATLRARDRRAELPWRTELELGLTFFRRPAQELAPELVAYAEAHAEDPDALAWLARAYAFGQALRDLDLSESYARRALARDRSSVVARVALSAVALDRGRLEEARRLLAEATTIEPEDIEALTCLGALEFRRRRLASACRLLGEVVARSPFQANAREGLIRCFLAEKAYEAAARAGLDYVEFCRQAARSPYPEVLVLLGDALVPLGRSGELFDLLESLAEAEGAHPDYAVVLAQAHAKFGRREEARRLVERVLRAHPDHPAALQLRERLDAAPR